MSTNNKVKVIYCCDRYHLDMVKVSIHSLFKLHPDADVRVFTIDIDKSELKAFGVTHLNYSDIPVNVDETCMYPYGFIRCSVLRLVAMDYLTATVGGRFLYVDADTVFLKPIDHLWDIDMGDNWLGAVEELFDPVGHEQGIYEKYDGCYEYRLSINPRYFNSGVLLFDCEKIPTNLYRFYLDKDYVGMMFKDQDTLNLLAQKYYPLEISYNAFYNFHFDQIFDAMAAFNEYERLSTSHIVHFIGWTKPHHRCAKVCRKTIAWPLMEYAKIAKEISSELPYDFVDNVENLYKSSGSIPEAMELRINR